MPPSEKLRLTDLGGDAENPLAGGAAFIAFCIGADARAKHRRDAINRSYAFVKRAARQRADPYPSALLLGQRAGVALEDAARQMRAFEALHQPGDPTTDLNDPFDVLRSGNVDALDEVFERYRDDAEGLRRVFRLPTPEATSDLDAPLRDAVLAASDALTHRWHGHWLGAVGGWQLLRRLAKGGRHGSPLIPRELVIEPPGAGALGDGSGDPVERWVLVSTTTVDREHQELITEYLPADLTDATLRLVRQAALDAIAVTREVANAQVYRMRSRSKWAMPREVIRLVSPEQARVLRAESR